MLPAQSLLIMSALASMMAFAAGYANTRLVPVHTPRKVQEDLLHYVWKFRMFNHLNLCSTDGSTIEVLHPGHHNQHAGPDFVDARLRIGGTLWAGNVEMHLTASDWFRHKHHHDAAYNSVVLHVVMDADEPIVTQNGVVPPALSLRHRIPEALLERYRAFQQARSWVPCERLLHCVDPLVFSMQLSRITTERLEERASHIDDLLAQTRNDWSAAFYILLARAFGFHVNSGPFEQLARSLPLRYIARHRDKLHQIEALVFGQAGFLDRSFEEAYPNRLREEYAHLKNKFKLRPINGGSEQWKFLRMRPRNFPTVRLAQFAQLLHQSGSLFSDVLDCESVAELEELFAIKASSYWDSHFRFGESSGNMPKQLGQAAVQSVIVNTVIPFLFVYGRDKGLPIVQDRAMRFLDAMPPECNHITRKWAELGHGPDSAMQSQALLQLHSRYCSEKKCLNCSVGNHLLKVRELA